MVFLQTGHRESRANIYRFIFYNWYFFDTQKHPKICYLDVHRLIKSGIYFDNKQKRNNKDLCGLFAQFSRCFNPIMMQSNALSHVIVDEDEYIALLRTRVESLGLPWLIEKIQPIPMLKKCRSKDSISSLPFRVWS